MLSLPWELLHDGKGFLVDLGTGIQVRRRLVGSAVFPRSLPCGYCWCLPGRGISRPGFWLPGLAGGVDPPTYPALKERLRWALEADEAGGGYRVGRRPGPRYGLPFAPVRLRERLRPCG